MPDTGRFIIRAFDAIFNRAGGVDRITALTLSCHRCSATTSSSDRELIHLPGGTLFKCGQCGCHQAVSNARVAGCVPAPLLGT
ncbi:MAG: hypothetical protein GAK31_00997 [Stenotrophomonas maltophilia]|uniref:Uncharacterized protein n=1 Tax=Stenotrophomonas maltophilia TaxID=40324 RepID=A0A7V8JLR1_STEMA|nr:MAG: hypothetical protein GAK31_00997 [Stenotrophomonas maltophilia]